MTRPRIALLPWGDAIEDFLAPLGLGLEDLRDELSGGWLFGYVDALATAGVDTTIVCCSTAVREPVRWTHGPTGAPLVVLPVPRTARRLRASLADPVAWSVEAAAGRPGRRAALAALPAHALAPYLATPVRALAAEARREGWRALLVQEYETARFDVCAALARRLGIRAVATFQGGDAPRTPLEPWIRPRAVRAADALVVAPAAEAARVRATYGVRAERIADVPNPLDVEAWAAARATPATRAELGLPADALVVAWHGRVEIARKGLDVLLDAWARVAPEPPGHPPRRLLLVGAGRDDADLRARLAGRADVAWVDRYVLDADRRAELLAAADVYAFPSRHEGFAVAPLEALACGLPVVAAAAPGVAELLGPDAPEGGLLVPTGDAGAFARALDRVLSEPELRARLGAAARRRAAAFAPEPVGRRLRAAVLGPG